MQPRVFISYTHKDSWFVDELAANLDASGIDVWIDKWEIKIGDSITERINDGIRESDFLILVLRAYPESPAARKVIQAQAK